MPTDGGQDQAPSLPWRLLDLLSGGWMAQAVSTAARLSIAELLADGPRSASDLAAATDCHCPTLQAFLRALCTLDILNELDDGRFEITAMGRFLGADEPLSIRNLVCLGSANRLVSLLETLRSGAARQPRRFQELQADPQAASVFNLAMAELTRLSAGPAARSYDFSGKKVADIGGGYGELIAAILEHHPRARGLLFDMEHAITTARGRIAARGLADRCELVVGDFFERIPSGADVYALKTVIHDWNDEKAIKILSNCREAMADGARLLLLERIVPVRMEATTNHRRVAYADLLMRVVHGAHERTEAEFRTLLAEAGFAYLRMLSAGTDFSWIEARPVGRG